MIVHRGGNNMLFIKEQGVKVVPWNGSFFLLFFGRSTLGGGYLMG